MTDFAELETKLRSLLTGKHSSLTLSFNEENGPNYMTVAEYEDSFGTEAFDWVSDKEREKARANNAVWTLQWYPSTPTQFCRGSASSLEAVLAILTAKQEASND